MWVQTKMWVQAKNFGPEKNLGSEKNVGPENIWVRKLRFSYFKPLRCLGGVGGIIFGLTYWGFPTGPSVAIQGDYFIMVFSSGSAVVGEIERKNFETNLLLFCISFHNT